MDSTGNVTTSIGVSHWAMYYTSRLRATFYALTPEETYVQHVKDVPDIQMKIMPVMLVITILELLVMKAKGEGMNFRLHNAVINYCTGHVNETGRMYIFRGAELSVYIWVYSYCRLCNFPWNTLSTYVLALVGVDLCTYWWHRMCHEVSFMWAAHYVHHSCEDMNTSVAARISITMRPFKWVYFLPLAFLGLPPPAFMIHSQLNFVWGFWTHNSMWPKTQKVIPVLGHVIEYIIVTPSHHRVHHGANKYCIDKNYGSTFIIWDRLFGTFAEEREDEELVYGTVEQKNNNHIIGVQVDPWRELWSRITAAETLGDKLRTLMYGPGWSSGQPRLGNIEDIPDVSGRKKHQFVPPAWFSFYLALHSFLLICCYIETSPRISEMSGWLSILYLCYVIMASGSLGGLYSAHKGSMWLEPVRLILSLAMCHLLPVFASRLLITCVSGINFVSLLMWPSVKSQALAMAAKKTK